MDNKKIRICIFIHYSTTASLPYYVQIYVEELSRHFDKVKVLSNNSKIKNEDHSLNSKIEFEYYENQGYDFGMFYRFIIKENLNNFSQIAIVNDSNILLKPLDNIFKWAKNNRSDFWGLIDSNEKPWFSTHKDNYHIQSHFIVLNKKAIKHLPEFLNSIEIEKIFGEENKKELRRKIINDWEIGFSQFLISCKLEHSAFIESGKILQKYSFKKKNVTHSLFYEIVANEDYPLLKKKVITTKKKWYEFKSKDWQKLVLEYGQHDWDLKKIRNELVTISIN